MRRDIDYRNEDMRGGRDRRDYTDRYDRRYDMDMRDMRYDGGYDYRDRGYDRRDRNYGRDSRDYGYGYHDYSSGKLSNEQLRKWQNELCENMDREEIDMFEKGSVIRQAEQMTIKFDKYSEEEFYTTVLMMFTDYWQTVGQNIAMYLALAKDFLEDKDAGVKYGEKLAAYYDSIVNV